MRRPRARARCRGGPRADITAKIGLWSYPSKLDDPARLLQDLADRADVLVDEDQHRGLRQDEPVSELRMFGRQP